MVSLSSSSHSHSLSPAVRIEWLVPNLPDWSEDEWLERSKLLEEALSRSTLWIMLGSSQEGKAGRSISQRLIKASSYQDNEASLTT